MGTIMNLVTPVLDELLYMGTMIELLGKFLVMKNDFAISMIRRSWIINDCPFVHLSICLPNELFVEYWSDPVYSQMYTG